MAEARTYTLSEELMRRAFKVATAFTGTAACAAAFAPGAGAATTARAQQMEPATSHRNCIIGRYTTSAVFYWPTSARHGPTCVGGANGITPTPLGNTFFSQFCAGNNSGIIFGTNPNDYAKFHRGDRFPIGWKVASVAISHFGGSSECYTSNT
jgi:hypothetical protein